MYGRTDLRREWLEAVQQVEQRKQKEAAREERRRRRVLAQIGYTPEEFEKGCREFSRKFYGESK